MRRRRLVRKMPAQYGNKDFQVKQVPFVFKKALDKLVQPTVSAAFLQAETGPFISGCSGRFSRSPANYTGYAEIVSFFQGMIIYHENPKAQKIPLFC